MFWIRNVLDNHNDLKFKKCRDSYFPTRNFDMSLSFIIFIYLRSTSMIRNTLHVKENFTNVLHHFKCPLNFRSAMQMPTQLSQRQLRLLIPLEVAQGAAGVWLLTSVERPCGDRYRKVRRQYQCQSIHLEKTRCSPRKRFSTHEVKHATSASPWS